LGLTTMPTEFPEVALRGGLARLLKGTSKEALEAILPTFLTQRRWFGGKNRQIREVEIKEVIPVPVWDEVPEVASGTVWETSVHVTLLDVQFLEADPEVYVLPLAVAQGAEADRVLAELPQAVVARLKGDAPGVLYDAMWDPAFCSAVLTAMARGESYQGTDGKLSAVALGNLAQELGDSGPAPVLGKGEQSNTSVVFGDKYIMKVFRRAESGVNPDLEIGRHLFEKQHFPHSPATVGFLEYRRRKGEPMTLATVQRLVANQGTGWQYTLDALGQYLEHVLSTDGNVQTPPELPASVADLIGQEVPPAAREAIGPYLESVRILGQRTAEMHAALAGDPTDPAFAPEPFSPTYQRSVYQSMRSEAIRVLQTLNKRAKALPEQSRELAQQVLARQADILARFQAVANTRMTGKRLRLHGDYHLGQVLWTGKDFVIIDFEGEPLRSITDRRNKRSVLRDVAGMVRSFHYAAYTALLGRSVNHGANKPVVRAEDFGRLETWCRYWYWWVGLTFVRSYRETAGASAFLPEAGPEFKTLTEAFILSKALYELGYELGHRPDWVSIPLLGILDILKTP
ncbi:MAG TPA: putative maltokinase, partial [Gemmata sp.]